MRKKNIFTLMLFLLLTACYAEESNSVSGELKDGLRVLSLTDSMHFTVYRGDYITFSPGEGKTPLLIIPDLDIKTTLPLPSGEYIKMKSRGVFNFTIDGKVGSLSVIELEAPNYLEVSAQEAFNLINNIDPLILDVRTEDEFNQGYIEGAMLIPVQILSGSIDKISMYKDEPVFIYCRSGNRSTVASRILLDAGFKNIYNLRFGIGDWISRGYPLKR